MSSSQILVVVTLVVLISLGYISAAPPNSSQPSPPKRIVNVKVGDHCALGAAPVGPNGSWQVVEKNVEKVCAPGSSCRKGACNCDDLPDGTIMGMSRDSEENRVCRRIAGQKCSKNSECFNNIQCVKGVCTCDEKSKQNYDCVESKNDVYILA